MFAILAAIAFGIALILSVIHQAGNLVTDFALAGLVCVALHLAFGAVITIRRPSA